MEGKITPCNGKAGDLDGENITINSSFNDGGFSLEALNLHRRRLGLDPSQNLIGSGLSRMPEGELFPFLSIISPTRPYNDENGDPDGLLSSSISAENIISDRDYPPAPRYRGNRALSRNRSADIPHEMNCRLWIAGLPPNCTVSELLREVRDIGPVYATHIVPPLIHGTKVNIATSAASLTFFTASAAHMFLLRHSVYPFTVCGYTTCVSRHRIRTKPVPVDGQSRVLLITGDPEIVNPETLTSLFVEKWNIRFETDFMKYTPGKGCNEIVWAFGSFRAQAQAAYIRLSQYPSRNITILYKPDPCA
ncbi:uncharacterized protein GGS22DRAFT_189510 [Annulohypoxylon maeteangense]|uniref:uncharacterized protein n=1 Tax=Annulohypoxylon maeteangense TaxID=1927788 RepID=UPI00200840FF|nr:uncharacterized protein GGS22DRAFT_189510 [Annulohypoxylon maeteangense]KAI0884381.1 hypothetical protein GGS22DRAFT_189510 [Annulohypoxylon maeteangense]